MFLYLSCHFYSTTTLLHALIICHLGYSTASQLVSLMPSIQPNPLQIILLKISTLHETVSLKVFKSLQWFHTTYITRTSSLTWNSKLYSKIEVYLPFSIFLPLLPGKTPGRSNLTLTKSQYSVPSNNSCSLLPWLYLVFHVSYSPRRI